MFVSIHYSLFQVESYQFGEKITNELIPNGSNVLVTNQNIISYIHKLANYKLNIEIYKQCIAFLNGFKTIININYIQIFNINELKLLINGYSNNKINLIDLKNNINYSGGYHASQPYIELFWSVIDELTIEEQSDFLKFVTSNTKQPLLGFKQLNPKFGIQKVPIYYENEINVARLPTAATCMNLLKLPQYNYKQQLKEKLLYAIKSNSGFELS